MTTDLAPVNGLQMRYEIHGSGQPLVLLHGTYMFMGSTWSKLLPTLAAHLAHAQVFQVITRE